jgi:hypothetical protein
MYPNILHSSIRRKGQELMFGYGAKVGHERFLYMRPTPASLSWRLDPDDSLSDWTLQVVSTDSISNRKRFHAHMEETVTQLPPEIGARTKMYFVHKTQLAIGERRSEYYYT